MAIDTALAFDGRSIAKLPEWQRQMVRLTAVEEMSYGQADVAL
jgi:DNA-directed RNA polymerase specialized sigma24 family protein